MTELQGGRERVLLEKFFTCLSNFTHDRAKDLVDKERDGVKNRSASLLWTSFLNQLNSLAMSEKSFYSLAFLSPNIGARFLGRRDVLISRYNFFISELQKIENAHQLMKVKTSAPTGDGRRRTLPAKVIEGRTTSRSEGSLESLGEETIEQMIVCLSGQLQHMATARMSIVRFYELLFTAAGNKLVSFAYENSITSMSDIHRAFSAAVTHPVLAIFRSSILRECEIAIHLLQCYVDIQDYRLISSLAQIKEAKLKLDAWGQEISASDNTINSSASVMIAAGATVSNTPELYDWLVLFKSAIFSKFSLYFCEVFIRETSLADVRSTMAKASIDYYAKFTLFHQKSDALSICLILNTDDLVEPYQGPGFHILPNPSDTKFVIGKPTGLDSFPAVFCCPPEKPEQVWPSMISILMSKYSELMSTDKVVYVFDESGKQNYSYFMIQTDPLVTLVAIYGVKKLMKDALIINSMASISADLRCVKVFALLKPGSK